MNWLSMHVLSDLWIGNNEFGMILSWDLYEVIGYKSEMELVWAWMLYWFMEHVVGMVRA